MLRAFGGSDQRVYEKKSGPIAATFLRLYVYRGYMGVPSLSRLNCQSMPYLSVSMP